MPTTPGRRLLPCGDRAVLLECLDLADTRAVRHRLDPVLADASSPVAEVVPGARTLLLRLRTAVDDPAVTALTGRLLGLSRTGDDERPDHDPPTADRVELPVDYDGADLDAVAELLGIDPAEVVARHTGTDWTVAFCGFAPGFGYLSPEPDAGSLVVPRRTTPRTRVPAGAVGLAGPFSGVYPRSGPGGWQLIGRTATVLWDLAADPPALLRPGTRVRFRDRAADRPAGSGR